MAEQPKAPEPMRRDVRSQGRKPTIRPLDGFGFDPEPTFAERSSGNLSTKGHLACLSVAVAKWSISRSLDRRKF